ncbi:hypothetical protein, partial [Pseudomonas putida]|uniref:hypothetical protein n=1 Tax=Pseudomonas putida TaxID=303 RepID=UPI001E44A10F
WAGHARVSFWLAYMHLLLMLCPNTKFLTPSGCRLCQAAMITFPQWMAASGVLAYRAGFGSVLF